MELTDLFTVPNLVALITLFLMELVLNVDNLVMMSIMVGNLPKEQRRLGNKVALWLATGLRIAMLFFLANIVKLTAPLFSVLGHGFSVRDLILVGGGLFLTQASTREIYAVVENKGHEHEATDRRVSFAGVMVQLTIMNAVFSIDSVITAVGMAESIPVMIAAVLLSVGAMIVFAEPLANFVQKHPSVKILALAFLLAIGLMLVLDGMHREVEKGYLYSMMVFAGLVQALNMRMHSKRARAAAQVRHDAAVIAKDAAAEVVAAKAS